MRIFQADKVDGNRLISDDILVCIFTSEEEYWGYINGTAEWGESLAEWGLEDRDIDFFCGEGVLEEFKEGMCIQGELCDYILFKEYYKGDF